MPTELPHEAAWHQSRAFLWGIDLFNHGYYWEAHEAWEALWIAAGRRGTAADLFKGLIKLAAAAVKLREGNAPGTRRHARRAGELFTIVERSAKPATGIYWGLPLSDLQRTAARLETLAGEIHAPAPRWHLPLQLKPQRKPRA